MDHHARERPHALRQGFAGAAPCTKGVDQHVDRTAFRVADERRPAVHTVVDVVFVVVEFTAGLGVRLPDVGVGTLLEDELRIAQRHEGIEVVVGERRDAPLLHGKIRGRAGRDREDVERLHARQRHAVGRGRARETAAVEIEAHAVVTGEPVFTRLVETQADAAAAVGGLDIDRAVVLLQIDRIVVQVGIQLHVGAAVIADDDAFDHRRGGQQDRLSGFAQPAELSERRPQPVPKGEGPRRRAGISAGVSWFGTICIGSKGPRHRRRWRCRTDRSALCAGCGASGPEHSRRCRDSTSR